MKRILLRAPKSPFEVVSAEATLDRNLIGTNSGNLLFIEAAHKILATRGVEVEPDRFAADPGDADRISERYDVYVIPLANAFRRRFEPQLIRLTRLIQRLRIPVVILGVGAQSDLTYATEGLMPLERSVKAFVSAVLDRSPSIGVRGEFSQHYLQGLGFRDVEVIGCPSMFLHGDRLRVEKKIPTLDRTAKVAINVSPYVRPMGEVVMRHHARYPNLTYIAQDLDTLALLLLGLPAAGASADDPIPVHPDHPLFRENKARFFIDPWPWLGYLRQCDFSFGTRIHGNIAALLAGTPATVLAHDSRTLEVARYFGIPHRSIFEMAPETDAADLYLEADFGDLNRGHAARFAAFTTFLGRHGLGHVFADGEDPTSFDARAAATPYPPAVEARTAAAGGPATLRRRIRFQVRRAARSGWVQRLRTAAARLR